MANEVKQKENMKYRFENFGGIIASQKPPFLAFVDREYMRELDLEESPLWNTEDESVGILSAPTEVHFAITNKCSAKCPHCYMQAGQKDEHELDTKSFKRALDVLAEINVFHIALGGGEALERHDLFEISEYARQKGLVPNLTISGAKVTPEIAKKMKVFGQVNISLDGVGEKYGVFRGINMFETADKAMDMLVEAGVPTGINCVIGRENFDGIDELFEYAKKKNLNEIEFLRFKPSGRAAQLYDKKKTTYEQNIALTPMLADLSKKHDITAKIDCSFIPMLCYHKPPRRILEAIATYGCEAGNVLLGIRSDGSVSGCSFLNTSGLSVFDLSSAENRSKCFEKIKTWVQNAPQPCCDCDYLDICKGGCHAVSEYVTGDFNNPDPDCPFVVEYKNEGISNG
ncbi:MAG: radical SAM protein [Planctomycetes bacterium]|nr:radical SAM protein [Planctomycetota bacterium]